MKNNGIPLTIRARRVGWRNGSEEADTENGGCAAEKLYGAPALRFIYAAAPVCRGFSLSP